jgi:hypothetical protein
MTLITDLIKQQQEEAKEYLKAKDVNGFTVYEAMPLDVDTLISQTVTRTLEALVGMCEARKKDTNSKHVNDTLTDLTTTLRAELSKGEVGGNE